MSVAFVVLALIGYGFAVVTVARVSDFNNLEPGATESHFETLEMRMGLYRG